MLSVLAKREDIDFIDFLSDEFLSKYPEFPKHMSPIGYFIFYRTYSRFLVDKRRRETWKETCKRSVNYNISLAYRHLINIGYGVDINKLKDEAQKLFHSMFNLDQFISGRTLWIGGAENGVAQKYTIANFNCSFTNITTWDDLVDVFYLLLVGTGVGLKCTREMARKIPKIRTNTKLLSSEYKPLPPKERLEDTKLVKLVNGYIKIYVGDSRKGWTDALKYYFMVLTNKEYEDIHTIKISYNSVRPRGERLKTFGGVASGHEPLKEMFEGIDRVLKNQIDPYLAPLQVVGRNYCKVRPIHILDIANLIGANVVCGGVRRTSEIFLFDEDDIECMLAKYAINGFKTEEQLAHHRKVGRLLGNRKPAWFDEIKAIDDGRFNLNHRRMSNNTAVFERKPKKAKLKLIMNLLQLEGEPGFFNIEAARRRRPNVEGMNPCFAGNMRLLTKDGYKTFEKLEGKQIQIISINGEVTNGKVWCSGKKETIKLTLSNKQQLICTPDHIFMSIGKKEIQAKDLKNVKIMPYMKTYNTYNEEYIKYGFIQGDGNLGRLDSDIHKGLEVNIGYKDADILFLFKNDQYTTGRRKIYLQGYNNKLRRLGFDSSSLPERVFPTSYSKWSNSEKASFIQGCYSANGSVIKTKRISYRTTCSTFAKQLMETLEKDFNIDSYLTTNKPKKVKFENGEYICKESYDINIGKYENIQKFNLQIGFYQRDKKIDLRNLLLYRAPYVINIKPAGVRKVYDFMEPKTHWGVVENCIVHNCAETLQDSKGLCNVTTNNIKRAIKVTAKGEAYLHKGQLFSAQRLSVRAALRMSLVDLELPDWHMVQQRDRLLGASLTGIKDAMGQLNYTDEQEDKLVRQLRKIANEEAVAYARELRVSTPLLVTTLKPEGTQSQLAGSVSSGVHYTEAPFYIRRIRINAFDPIVKTIIHLGWPVYPEAKTPGDTYEEQMKNARTVVTEFPIASGSKVTKKDISARKQLENYFRYQKNYVDQNTSVTITVRKEEWKEVEQIVWDRWDELIAASFIQFDYGTYELLPFEAITEEKYWEMKNNMKPFDPTILQLYDTGEDQELTGIESCEGGSCPVR